MFSYLKKAFLNQWNLLLFAGGCGAATVAAATGNTELAQVILPIVMAVEIGYLGLLGTHPKFQSYVDAQAAKESRQRSSQDNQQILEKIRRGLPDHLYNKYRSLKKRCLRLGAIANDLKTPNSIDSALDLDSMQSKGLDRLLWVYLRLLYSQHALEQFFDTVSEKKIESDLKRISKQLDDLGVDDQSAHASKMRRALTDNRATLQERLDNYQRAHSNFEFVSLELDRVENKIKSLAELTVNRQDPEYISGQIDAVADSMMETERTMNDLQFVTGLGQVEEEAPELISEPETFVID